MPAVLGWGPFHGLSHPHPTWLGDAHPNPLGNLSSPCSPLVSVIVTGSEHPQTSSPGVPTVSRVLTGGEIVAIVFGLLLGVALLLGVLVFRSRCCSCPPHPPPRVPLPGEETPECSPPTQAPVCPFPPPCTPTPSCFWGRLSWSPLGPQGGPGTLRKLIPIPHRKSQQRRRHQRQQRQRDRVTDGDRGEPGAPLCVCACWEVPLRWDPGTHIGQDNSEGASGLSCL